MTETGNLTTKSIPKTPHLWATDLSEINEENLQNVMQDLKKQLHEYHDAGHTQVSAWLE